MLTTLKSMLHLNVMIHRKLSIKLMYFFGIKDG